MCRGMMGVSFIHALKSARVKGVDGCGGLNMENRIVLPRLLSGGCVLQCGEKTRIWGKAPAGVSVLGTLAGQSCQAEAGDDGYFEAYFQDLQPGGPFVLEVSAEGCDTVVVSPVYVGEVFVCAGQSNMELPMRRVRERFPEEFQQGGCEGVHLYKVTECTEFAAPLWDHTDAGWKVCVEENLADVSAVSYFLGKEIYGCRKVPVGILNLSLGGTPVEAWTSVEGILRWPELLEIRSRYQDEDFRRRLTEVHRLAEEAWQEEIRIREMQCISDTWETIELPGYLESAGIRNFCGSIWLRRKFAVSDNMAGKPALLRLGTMTDSDQTYVNGVLVGETGYCYPPRRYQVPAGLLRCGENEILIRLVCRAGGGRVTPGKPCEIVAGGERILLAGKWEYQIRAAVGPAPEQEFINRRPTGLFQGMVAPCLPCTVRGVVWYQGESNDGEPGIYGERLKNMICDWRGHWRQNKLPFVVVQLPDCDVDVAEGQAWPLIREAQSRAAELPDVAVTVNLDLGEDNDLHPVDKKSVAARIARAVRGMIFGESVVWKSPSVTDFRRDGKGVTLVFDTWGGSALSTTDGRDPGEFECAGHDGIFYPAAAKISGNEVAVWLPGNAVKKIEDIRYAWSRAPRRGLLCSAEGLTAGPFRLKISDR